MVGAGSDIKSQPLCAKNLRGCCWGVTAPTGSSPAARQAGRCDCVASGWRVFLPDEGQPLTPLLVRSVCLLRQKRWVINAYWLSVPSVCSNDGVFDVALHVHVQVYSTGRITWTPPALYCSSCGVKVNINTHANVSLNLLLLGASQHPGLVLPPGHIFPI